MLELKGKYSTAQVFTDNIESEAISQIIELCDQEFVKDCSVRIMPDVHAGKGCVIGFTADLGDKIIPNIVGVDIGCGMLCVKLYDIDIDLSELDNIINRCIPAGFNIHPGKQVNFPELQELYCYRELKDTRRIIRSIGTLGGGNHFIELNIDKIDNKYLVIHSGSRNLGKQVADHYQNLAVELCSGKADYYEKRDTLIKEYKKQGKKKALQRTLLDLKRNYEGLQPEIPKHLCYLTGKYRDKYLHDMKICQEYAAFNRETIANIILSKLLNKKLDDFEHFETIHNYINFRDNIIRKGSVSAYQDEELIIPINMRDGSILAVGKGSSDWNYSAPHGAGRLMSRSRARQILNLEEFEQSMQGIYTSSVCPSTIDEAPMAYKPLEEILNNISDTVNIIEMIKPVYNFKAK